MEMKNVDAQFQQEKKFCIASVYIFFTDGGANKIKDMSVNLINVNNFKQTTDEKKKTSTKYNYFLLHFVHYHIAMQSSFFLLTKQMAWLFYNNKTFAMCD